MESESEETMMGARVGHERERPMVKSGRQCPTRERVGEGGRNVWCWHNERMDTEQGGGRRRSILH